MGIVKSKENFSAISLSGGKDSTALMLLMIEKGLPIDSVLYADTTMDFPEMEAHIAKLDDLLFRECGIHITTLRHPHGFEWLMFDEPKVKPSCLEKRARLGIPPFGNGWPGAVSYTHSAVWQRLAWSQGALVYGAAQNPFDLQGGQPSETGEERPGCFPGRANEGLHGDVQLSPAGPESFFKGQGASFHDAQPAGRLELYDQGPCDDLQGGHGGHRHRPEGAGEGRVHCPASASRGPWADYRYRVHHLRAAPGCGGSRTGTLRSGYGGTGTGFTACGKPGYGGPGYGRAGSGKPPGTK